MLDLKSGYGKKVKVTTIDNEVFEGLYCTHTNALDNEPEVESITIEKGNGLTEIYAPEIKSIEILQN